MTAALARAGLLAGFGRNHHHAAVFDAALGNDVIGEMLHLGAGAAQGGNLHAVVVVEVDMQRRQREIMVAMVVLDQPARQIARGMVIDLDQGCDAIA